MALAARKIPTQPDRLDSTVEGYFDTYSIDASNPTPPADEYVYRTSIVDDFNTSTFKVFPSYEMGQQKHTNRFNFGITDVSQYRSYTYGADGIQETQQIGYPAQLNHPGTTVTVQEAIAEKGLGADFLELRDQPWIDAWDGLRVRSFGWLWFGPRHSLERVTLNPKVGKVDLGRARPVGFPGRLCVGLRGRCRSIRDSGYHSGGRRAGRRSDRCRCRCRR